MLMLFLFALSQTASAVLAALSLHETEVSGREIRILRCKRNKKRPRPARAPETKVWRHIASFYSNGIFPLAFVRQTHTDCTAKPVVAR